jgi:hypothetical protein
VLLAGLGAAGVLVGFFLALSTRPHGHPGHGSGPGDPPSHRPGPGQPDRRALLVGVTRYDHLPEHLHLTGPGNDVRAVRQLLQSQYHFSADHIITLAEDAGADHRPTRANIERAFRRLADEARSGDQVVVLLAGHGDRQPESDPPHPLYPEPDGIDEIFLPADVRPARGTPKRAPNAIVDDEIGAWLDAITAKGAFVWAIFDCCHSGHMNRGSEVVRELPPGTLVPADSLDRARQRAGRRQGKPDKRAAFIPAKPSGRLVALYACRPHEQTPECPFPEDSTRAKYHGLLTYTLLQALAKSAASPAPLTYRELVQRIQARYASRPQGAPTPTVVGSGQDRVVLGSDRPERPRLTLRRHRDEYRVDEGDLFGLTAGSVLEVFSPAGQTKQPRLLGHVRVLATRPFDSTVTPCEYHGVARPGSLPELAPCRVVYRSFRLHRLKVAVQAGKGREAARQQVLKALAPLQKEETGLVEVVADPRAAAWLVRLSDGRPELVEASGNREPHCLPAVGSEDFAGKLRDGLETVFRARNLLAVSERLERAGAPAAGLGIDLEVLRHTGEDDPGKVAPRPAGGWVFRPGDEVSFRIRNRGREAVYVQLLLVGADLKIGAFHPAEGEEMKELPPGKAVRSQVGEIKPNPPFGQEYLVAVVTKAKGPPVDLRPLAQGGLRGAGIDESSPLAELLEQALFRTGQRSGLEQAEMAETAVRVLGWRTERLPAK